MELEENAEELLESLWITTKEESKDFLSVTGHAAEGPIKQLVNTGYVTLAGDQLRLTSAGIPAARNVVRRHRLAERLLADVLGASDELMHEKACRFEHLLDQGLDESICRLLGHPKICPHGKPIPAGRCCSEPAPSQKLVAPLSRLSPGEGGKVAYVYAPESGQFQKLMALGILPGTPISLVQTFPSYVFKAGQTQFAVDREIAEAIYVRLVAPEEATPAPQRKRGWGWRSTKG